MMSNQISDIEPDGWEHPDFHALLKPDISERWREWGRSAATRSSLGIPESRYEISPFRALLMAVIIGLSMAAVQCQRVGSTSATSSVPIEILVETAG